MTLKEVSDRPTSGQWVEMWEYNGKPWAQVVRQSRKNSVERFDFTVDKFVPDDDISLMARRYFVAVKGGES